MPWEVLTSGQKHCFRDSEPSWAMRIGWTLCFWCSKKRIWHCNRNMMWWSLFHCIVEALETFQVVCKYLYFSSAFFPLLPVILLSLLPILFICHIFTCNFFFKEMNKKYSCGKREEMKLLYPCEVAPNSQLPLLISHRIWNRLRSFAYWLTFCCLCLWIHWKQTDLCWTLQWNSQHLQRSQDWAVLSSLRPADKGNKRKCPGGIVC